MIPHDEEFRTDQVALAFFITFRTYGTWLHGDPRGSIDRFHNRFGTPKLPPSKMRMQRELELLKQPPVRLSRRQRVAAADGIREICKKRNWDLWIVNVRTNHAHSVITANCNSKKVRSAIKANATKMMREKGLWRSSESPWAAKGSRKHLWTQKQLINAIVYVMYDQGEY
jgi:REP element-mobilizing transposase RayT